MIPVFLKTKTFYFSFFRFETLHIMLKAISYPSSGKHVREMYTPLNKNKTEILDRKGGIPIFAGVYLFFFSLFSYFLSKT